VGVSGTKEGEAADDEVDWGPEPWLDGPNTAANAAPA
jgi:hypothetical protein